MRRSTGTSGRVSLKLCDHKVVTQVDGGGDVVVIAETCKASFHCDWGAGSGPSVHRQAFFLSRTSDHRLQ